MQYNVGIYSTTNYKHGTSKFEAPLHYAVISTKVFFHSTVPAIDRQLRVLQYIMISDFDQVKSYRSCCSHNLYSYTDLLFFVSTFNLTTLCQRLIRIRWSVSFQSFYQRMIQEFEDNSFPSLSHNVLFSSPSLPLHLLAMRTALGEPVFVSGSGLNTKNIQWRKFCVRQKQSSSYGQDQPTLLRKCAWGFSL